MTMKYMSKKGKISKRSKEEILASLEKEMRDAAHGEQATEIQH